MKTYPITPEDRADIISHNYGSTRLGTHALGVQVLHPKDDGKGYDPERYALIFGVTDTRADVVKKLRALAEAMESGVGAVWGNNVLVDSELNAKEYPPRRARDPKDTAYEDDFRPNGIYRQWEIKTLRTVMELAKECPLSLP